MIWIAIEGPDGVGKTTAVGLLVKHFENKGRNVVQYTQPHNWRKESRDPALSWTVRRLLLHADNEIVMDLIGLLRKEEAIVVTDRWHQVSEKVYATAGGQNEYDFSCALLKAIDGTRVAWKGQAPLPRIVIKLGDKIRTLEERLKEKKDRLDVFESNKEFRNNVRRIYEYDIPNDILGVPIETINCEGLSYDDVHDVILRRLAERGVI